MDAFPAYFPLAGKTVVVAGSGEAAEAKARLFVGSPANVLRIEGAAALEQQTYCGAVLAFIADPDEAFVTRAAAAARSAGVLVNVTDRPQLCDFTTPAVIDRGEVVAAIGTGGASPMLAAMLRNDIEQQIPEGTGRVAALFRQFQEQVRTRFPELGQRRAFLRLALSGPAAQAALAGDMVLAAEHFVQAINAGAATLGSVQYIDGKGPADLITLRASRALAAADILIVDPAIDLNIVAMVRRDAERMPLEAATTQYLARQVAAGRRVVRIVSTPPHREMAELAEFGSRVEVLATAIDLPPA